MPLKSKKEKLNAAREQEMICPKVITPATRKELSTEDRVLQIKARLIKLPETFSFETLVDDCHDIHEYIVSFLAILDMAKNHLLSFVVGDNDEIVFSKGAVDE